MRKKFTINLLFNIFNIFYHSSSNTHNSSLNSTFCNSLYNYFPHLRLYYVQTNNYYFFLLFRVMLPALYNPAPRTQLTHYVSTAAFSTSPSATSMKCFQKHSKSVKTSVYHLYITCVSRVYNDLKTT